MGGVREGMGGRGQPLSAAVNTATSVGGGRQIDVQIVRIVSSAQPGSHLQKEDVLIVSSRYFAPPKKNGTRMRHDPLSHTHTHSLCTTSFLTDASFVPNCKLPFGYFTAVHVNAEHFSFAGCTRLNMDLVVPNRTHRIFLECFGFFFCFYLFVY